MKLNQTTLVSLLQMNCSTDTEDWRIPFIMKPKSCVIIVFYATLLQYSNRWILKSIILYADSSQVTY